MVERVIVGLSGSRNPKLFTHLAKQKAGGRLEGWARSLRVWWNAPGSLGFVLREKKSKQESDMVRFAFWKEQSGGE